MSHRSASLRLFTLLVIAANSLALSALSEEALEYKVKAGCLFNFAKFVDWPANTFPDQNAPIIIGILGSDPFGEALGQTVQDREISGRKVVVRKYSDPQNAREAQILFVGLKGDLLASALKSLEHSSVLTVGENSSFTDAGGIVCFVIRDGRVSFDINPEAGKKAGLKIGSQLLRVAHIVSSKGE